MNSIKILPNREQKTEIFNFSLVENGKYANFSLSHLSVASIPLRTGREKDVVTKLSPENG